MKSPQCQKIIGDWGPKKAAGLKCRDLERSGQGRICGKVGRDEDRITLKLAAQTEVNHVGREILANFGVVAC